MAIGRSAGSTGCSVTRCSLTVNNRPHYCVRIDGAPDDTFFIGPAARDEIEPLDIRDPRSRHLFRIDDSDIALDRLRTGADVDAPTVSASMATALLAYSGIADLFWTGVGCIHAFYNRSPGTVRWL